MIKCKDCKKIFEYIDANQRCIECWDKFNRRLRMSVWRYRLFSLDCFVDEIGYSIKSLFRTKICYCRCECQ